MMSQGQSRQRQSGTVLIIAVLIVGVITALAVNFTSEFQISMARGEQRLYSGQLQQYWFGIESFAIWGLRRDKDDDVENYGNGAAYDHLGELWSTTETQAPLEGGYAKGSLEDAQGRFNLNQLGEKVNPPKPNGSFEEKYTPQQKRFIRLLQTLPGDLIGTVEAEEITQAVIDWIDADDTVTGIGGAESDFYLSKEQPHRAANQPFVSVSELRLIKGMTEELYEWLAPLTVALPDVAGININTALPQVLRTLNAPATETPLEETDLETLQALFPTKEQQDNQDQEAFDNLDDFLNSSEAQQVFGSDQALWPNKAGLVTGSNFFLLNTEVEVADVVRRGYSLLNRRSDGDSVSTRVIRRSSEEVF